MVASISLLAVAGVLASVAHWWRRRSRDVSAAIRAAVLATAATALVVPMLGVTVAGVPATRWWVFLVPLAWAVVAVVSCVEQRQARVRDTALGAPRRHALWHPGLVGLAVFGALFAIMLCALVGVFAITGDVSTSTVAALGGAVLCGSLVMTWTQMLRRSRAATEQNDRHLVDDDAIAARIACSPSIGALVVAAAVLWAATLTFGSSTAQDAALVLASCPGWALVGLGWACRPVSPADY